MFNTVYFTFICRGCRFAKVTENIENVLFMKALCDRIMYIKQGSFINYEKYYYIMKRYEYCRECRKDTKFYCEYICAKKQKMFEMVEQIMY